MRAKRARMQKTTASPGLKGRGNAAVKKARVRKTAGLLFGQYALFVLIILAVCMSADVHIALLRVFNAAERTGFSPDEIDRAARAMVSVIKGADRQMLSQWFTADEVLHMKDVQELFSLGLKAFIVLMLAFILCMAGGKRPVRAEYRRAFWLSLLLPAAVALPFIVDFNGMWIFLHRVAFPQNELWLMDPRVHKMVVMYSGQFFIAVVALIGVLCALSMLPLAIGAVRAKDNGD